MGFSIAGYGGSTYRAGARIPNIPPPTLTSLDFSRPLPPFNQYASGSGVAILPSLIRSITMGAFSKAFTQLFSALTVLFTAFESICNTANNLATVAEESSGSYKDQARIDRAMKLAQLEHDRATAAKALTNQVQP